VSCPAAESARGSTATARPEPVLPPLTGCCLPIDNLRGYGFKTEWGLSVGRIGARVLWESDGHPWASAWLQCSIPHRRSPRHPDRMHGAAGSISPSRLHAENGREPGAPACRMGSTGPWAL